MSNTPSEQNMQDLLSQLRTGPSLPGLSPEPVADNYVEIELKDSLDECKTEEERRERKQRFVQYYITGPGKAFLIGVIDQVKAYYQQAKDFIESLLKAVQGATASNTVPSVITVGQATSTANPTYAALENGYKKQQFLSIINSAKEFLSKLLELAMLIHFVLPDSVLALVTTLTMIATLITNIPAL